MTELGVGNQHAIVEHGGADSSSDGHHHHDPAAAACGSEAGLRDARRVRVVQHDARTIGRA